MEWCKEVSVKILGGLLILSSTMFIACASTSKVFPLSAMVGVDRAFDFAGWRMTPNEAINKKVQLGGQIVEAQLAGDSVSIVVSHLPIVDRPAYGPRDMGQDNGQFVVLYPGRIGTPFLQPGNRIMIVGRTGPMKTTSVRGFLKSLPTMEAECVHVWATGGRQIEDFPHMPTGYMTLDEETACAKNQ